MEKYEQPKWSSDDHVSGSGGQARSYTCTYCKRGFSNAQALGGHMNIHRRDKARLRQFCEENENDDGDGDGQDSSATTIKSKIINPTVSNLSLPEEQSASFNHVITARNSSEEPGQNIPVLFEGSIGKIDCPEEEKIRAEEPDLELRLGLSSAASSTRNFF